MDGNFAFFFSSRRQHTRSDRDWSSDVCSSDLDWSAPEVDKELVKNIEKIATKDLEDADRKSVV